MVNIQSLIMIIFLKLFIDISWFSWIFKWTYMADGSLESTGYWMLLALVKHGWYGTWPELERQKKTTRSEPTWGTGMTILMHLIPV